MRSAARDRPTQRGGRRARSARRTPGPSASDPRCGYRRTARTSSALPPQAATSSFSANSPGSPAAATSARSALGVVGDALDRRSTPPHRPPRTAKRAARVTVLGLADRAAVDEAGPRRRCGSRACGCGRRRAPVALGRGEPLVQVRRLVLEQVLVDLARRAVDQVDALRARARSAGRRAGSRMKSFERLVGVRERPVDRRAGRARGRAG